ncbi:hypothetical protein P8C59_003786 [Phyllachora maydis]|uniref:Uncharacterized protein n=1 Tax=Phyllachora maydis TaxID=1825666 RepID=A0AAD9MAP1_9PEZI|nr:hypothetical protein P8C59_003786 [Phyllachora maydis]
MAPLPNDPFTLPASTPRASKTTLNLAGIPLHLFGVAELTPAQAAHTTVLFHLHGRGQTHAASEAVAHHLLHAARAGEGDGTTGERGLVVAAMDGRNHGARAVGGSEAAVRDWRGGNERHALDMLATMAGTGADVATAMDLLAAYVDGVFVPARFAVAGFSLGAHVVWDVLGRDARVREGVAVVGCPDLTHLLLHRLGRYKEPGEVPPGTARWPKTTERLLQQRDAMVAGIRGKDILILNGAEDKMVPPRFTRPWVDKYGQENRVEMHELPDTGHTMTWDMAEKTVDWVMRRL